MKCHVRIVTAHMWGKQEDGSKSEYFMEEQNKDVDSLKGKPFTRSRRKQSEAERH